MAIRPARPEEADALSQLALRSKAYWGYDPEFLESCRAELTISSAEVGSKRITVLEERGELVGFYGLANQGPTGELTFLFVEPRFIGRGHGRRLWAHALARAEAAGIREVQIEADPGAEPFYLRMGARRVGEVRSGSWPGRTLPLLCYQVPSGAAG